MAQGDNISTSQFGQFAVPYPGRQLPERGAGIAAHRNLNQGGGAISSITTLGPKGGLQRVAGLARHVQLHDMGVHVSPATLRQIEERRVRDVGLHATGRLIRFEPPRTNSGDIATPEDMLSRGYAKATWRPGTGGPGARPDEHAQTFFIDQSANPDLIGREVHAAPHAVLTNGRLWVATHDPETGHPRAGTELGSASSRWPRR